MSYDYEATDEEIVDAMMAAYDREFPNANEFPRNSAKFEFRKAVEFLRSAGVVMALP